MDECIHGMLAQSCSMCMAPPSGVSTKVYITKGGWHFHNRADCPALSSGWEAAHDRGQETHPVQLVHWQEASENRSRCKTCIPKS